MKNTRWSPEDMKRLGLIEFEGRFVPAKNQTTPAHRVNKFPVPIYDSSGKLLNPAIKPSGNKKIRNANKSVNAEGVKFDSNLEKYMYGLIKASGLSFEFQRTYVLQEGFRYNGDAVRPITLTVDFWLPTKNMVIDTKGFANDIAPVKYKMLKGLFCRTNGIPAELPRIEIPSTQKECDLLLNRLLFEK